MKEKDYGPKPVVQQYRPNKPTLTGAREIARKHSKSTKIEIICSD